MSELGLSYTTFLLPAYRLFILCFVHCARVVSIIAWR